MPNGPQKLILIRAGRYDYAEVELSGSLQIVGPNNTGKTTLINTLQFLYLDDRRHERGALVSIHAESRVILRRWNLWRTIRQADRRGERDNRARKKQHSRAAAKNVSANFAFRFHRFIELSDYFSPRFPG